MGILPPLYGADMAGSLFDEKCKVGGCAWGRVLGGVMGSVRLAGVEWNEGEGRAMGKSSSAVHAQGKELDVPWRAFSC